MVIHVGIRREFHCTIDLCDYVKFKTDTPDSESEVGVRSLAIVMNIGLTV